MAVYKHKKDMELIVSEQRLANTLNTISEAVIITDYDGAITFLNPRVETMLSLDLRSTIGKELKSVIAFDMDKDAVDYYHVRQTTQFKNVEAKIISTSENQIFNLTISPIIDEKHNLIGRAFVLSDTEKNNSPVFQRMALENMVEQDAFFIKRGSQLIKVLTENIFWVQAMDNYVIIQSNSDQFIIHSTMKDIESKLPSALFARVHRSYIVNISKIQMLDENDVIISEKSIPIGKSYKDGFKQRLSFL